MQLHHCKNPKMVKLCVATFTTIAELTNFSNLYSFLHSTTGKSCTKGHVSSAHGLKGVTGFFLPVGMACSLWKIEPVQTRLMEEPETVVCLDQGEHDTILQHAGRENQEHPWEGGTPVLLDNGGPFVGCQKPQMLICKRKNCRAWEGQIERIHIIIILLLLVLTWSHRKSSLICITQDYFYVPFHCLPPTHKVLLMTLVSLPTIWLQLLVISPGFCCFMLCYKVELSLMAAGLTQLYLGNAGWGLL